MEERSSGNEIGPNLTERMADRVRPAEPELDELPLPVIDTDLVAGVVPPIDDV